MSKKTTADADAERDETEEEAIDTPASPDDSEDETTDDSEENRSSKEDDIDYEALQHAEIERTKKPDISKAREAFEKRKKSRQEDEDDTSDTDDEDRPMTFKDAQRLFSGITKQTQRAEALAIARTNTSSEAEAQAAVTYWETRVNPTGDLRDDVLFAIGGLNHRKVISKNAELARALRSKDTASKDTAGTHRDPAQGPAPKVSANSAASFKRAGFVLDTKDKIFKKKLPSGKFLCKDPKTKRTWVSN